MSNLLQKPAVVVALGVVSGLVAGIGWVWRAGDAIVAHLPVASATAAGHPKAAAKAWDFWSEEIDNLSNDLKEERERLRTLSAQLDQRAARIAAERKELDQARAEIDSTRNEVKGLITEIGESESKNLKSLAATYSNLTPRAAVAVIRELDDTTAVKILFLMKPEAVSPIFEEMSRTADTDGTLAKRAASLSERLRLLRSAKPPTS